jgi:hypothetical protein
MDKNYESVESHESIQSYLQRIQFDPEKPEEEYDSDTDTDSDSSDTDSDDFDDDSSKVSIVIPELYMRCRYGNKAYLKSHIMVLYRFEFNRNNCAKFFKRLEKIALFHRHIMWRRAARTLYNKGYSINQINANANANISKHNISYQLHLAQCIQLATGETVCVIKTFWLKIIQRTWKKVFKERRRMLKNIYLRQIRGKVFMPSLTGMLWIYGV